MLHIYFSGLSFRRTSKAREHGMEVFERGTSSHCAYHDEEVERSPRGVVECPIGGHKLHDINGTLNILRRGSGTLVHGDLRPLSFVHSGPQRGRAHQLYSLQRGR